MKLVTATKFNIGDKVRKYVETGYYKSRVCCPLCGGKHTVEYDDDFLTCDYCDEDGYINKDYVKERILDDEIYKINSIQVHLNDKGISSIRYGISSTPELNNRSSVYISSSADETDLELVV